MAQLTALTVLLIGCFLALRSLRHPGAAAALVLSVFAMEQALQAAFGIFVSRSWLVNVAVGAVASVAAFQSVIRSPRTAYHTFNSLALPYGLLAIAAASTLWSPDTERSIERLLSASPYLALAAVVTPYCLARQSDLANVCRALVLLGTPLLLALAVQEYRGRAIQIEGKPGSSLNANPLEPATFAGYMLLLAIFAVPQWLRSNPGLIVRGLIVGLAVFVSIKSGARGQLLAVVLSSLVTAPLLSARALSRGAVYTIALAASITGIAALLLKNSTQTRRWTPEIAARDIQGRIHLSQELLAQWVDAGPVAWLIGLGSSASYPLLGTYCHIVPVEVLCELGILGFTFFAAFLYSALTTCYSHLKQLNVDTTDRRAIGFFLSLLIFQFTLSLKQGSLIGSANLFLIASIALAVIPRGRDRLVLDQGAQRRETLHIGQGVEAQW